MSTTNRAQDLLQQIADERARAGRFRTMCGLTIVVMFGIFAGIIYNKITNFDTNQLITELQRSASRTVWPLVYKELDRTGQEALPALSKAMNAEISKIGPDLTTRLTSEAETFQRNMAAKMKTSLDAKLGDAFDRNKGALTGSLQPFTSDGQEYDDLVRKLQKSAQDWAQDTLDTTFAEHVKLLQSINETVQRLGDQAKKKGGGEETMDDVLLLVAEILNARVDGEG